MIRISLQNFFQALQLLAERFTSKRHWEIRTAFLALAVSLFFSFPSYEVLSNGAYEDVWKPVLEKFADPFKDMADQYGPGSHASKLSFRITVPLIAHVFGLGVYGSIGLQFLFGFLLFLLTAHTVGRLVNDRVVALFITLLVGSVFAGITSFVELRGVFDGVAICLVAVAVFARNPIVVGSSIFLAAWTDERALIASPLVLLFHLYPENTGKHSRVQNAIGIVLSWVAYVGTRLYMSRALHIDAATGGVGPAVFLSQVNIIPMGLWTALEGGWILFFFSLAALYKKTHYWFLVFLCAAQVWLRLSPFQFLT